MFYYIDIISPKEGFPEVWQIPPETLCISLLHF